MTVTTSAPHVWCSYAQNSQDDGGQQCATEREWPWWWKRGRGRGTDRWRRGGRGKTQQVSSKRAREKSVTPQSHTTYPRARPTRSRVARPQLLRIHTYKQKCALSVQSTITDTERERAYSDTKRNIASQTSPNHASMSALCSSHLRASLALLCTSMSSSAPICRPPARRSVVGLALTCDVCSTICRSVESMPASCNF